MKKGLRNGKIIICIICGTSRYYEARKIRDGAKYCSSKCYFKDKKGKPTWNKGLKGYKLPNISKALKGKKASFTTKLKMSIQRKGRQLNEKNPRWKGEDASYSSKHQWIYKRKGKANMCILLKDNTCKGVYQWANISGQYLRNINDFMPLCVSHHRRLDSKRRHIGYFL